MLTQNLLLSNWQIAQRFAPNHDILFPDGGEKNWISAQVPGHIHPDLVRAGIIADPLARMHELGCRWVDEADWTYRTVFEVSPERLAARGTGGRHFLHFGGLDTVCRVYLNGAQIGQAENFFTPHRFDVTNVLREGENEVRVEFDSPLRVGSERARAYLGDGKSERGAASYFNFAPRAFVRKPQYMFGWDWGPELVSCGIWQPVELRTVPVAEIVDFRMEYDFFRPNWVKINLKITVDKYDDTPLTVGAALYAVGDNTPSAQIPDEPGRHTINLVIEQQKVVRWDVNGMVDKPKRYLLNFKVWETPQGDDASDEDVEPEIVAFKGTSVGFRTVELIQEPDADENGGQSFGFRINGRDTFIKGANWIPDACFPGNIPDTRLRERITQARDAGFNMLRVWGGGLYESETFYNLCDELGILVWQDFAFACSMYPDDLPEFNHQVRAEAIANVRRIRHRACLALWCGGNENMELFQGRWAGQTQAARFFGDHTIHQLLPDVLAAEDTRTPYWPNSPYGGENVADETIGDSHYWNVWHAKTPDSNGDWKNYAQSTSRFSSEFGFASPAGESAWRTAQIAPGSLPDAPDVLWHDKTRKGWEKYRAYVEMHFPQSQNLRDFTYYGQMNQADALTFGVEHYRRSRPRCGGTLFWQLNDCWPTHSWAVIDSAGDPKAAYFAARRFYAPLIVSLVEENGIVEAHLINDTETEERGALSLRLRYFDGRDAAPAIETEAGVGANTASGAVASLVLPPDVDREDVFVQAVFISNATGNKAEKILLVAEPKHLRLPDPELTMEHEPDPNDGTRVLIHLTANQFAAYVWLAPFAGAKKLSDNGFHLAPGETKTVVVSGLSEKAIKVGEQSAFRYSEVYHLQNWKDNRPKRGRPDKNAD